MVNTAQASSFRQALDDVMVREMLRRAAHLSLTTSRTIVQPDTLRMHFPDALLVDDCADLFFLTPDFMRIPQPFTQTILRVASNKLADSGALLFATPTPDTRFILNEPGAPACLHDWPTLIDLGNALMQSGFQQPALERDAVIFSYASVDAIRADLVPENWWIDEKALSAWLAQLNPKHNEYLVPVNIVYGMALKKPNAAVPQTIRWHR